MTTVDTNLGRDRDRVSDHPQTSGVRRPLGMVLSSTQGRIGVGILVLFAITAIVGAVWRPDPGMTIDIEQSPSFSHPFGTDGFGRDIFERTLGGGYRLLLVSILSAACAMLIGMSVGALMAYRRGVADMMLGRTVDILLSFPGILIALLIAAMLPSGYVSLFVVATVIQIPLIIRVTRGIFVDVFSREFMLVAILRGDPLFRIVGREAIPNVLGLLLVEFALRWSFAILIIASLNFLGVGVQPPAADWGLMMYEGRSAMLVAPWAVLFPAAAIAVLTIGITFTADAVARATRGAGDVTEWSR